MVVLDSISAIASTTWSVLQIANFMNNPGNDVAVEDALSGANGQYPYLELWNTANQNLYSGAAWSSGDTGTNAYRGVNMKTSGGQLTNGVQIQVTMMRSVLLIGGQNTLWIGGYAYEYTNADLAWSGVILRDNYVKCIWLDRDYTNDIQSGTMRFDFNLNRIRESMVVGSSRAKRDCIQKAKKKKEFPGFMVIIAIDAEDTCADQRYMGSSFYNNATSVFCGSYQMKSFKDCKQVAHGENIVCKGAGIVLNQRANNGFSGYL
ncbi:unnamed protein product [Cunninghamella echinulata]